MCVCVYVCMNICMYVSNDVCIYTQFTWKPKHTFSMKSAMRAV